MSMFANNLFTHLGEVNPSVKDRYLEAGFAIVGEHPQAARRARCMTTTGDLVTEIRLVARSTAPARWAPMPSACWWNCSSPVRSSARAAASTSTFQNQANAISSGYYYNYGRPQENYRDKFEEAVHDPQRAVRGVVGDLQQGGCQVEGYG
ncbi:MAG: hypothetical protein R3E96_02605 [Planctomycetota bacterium]